MKSSWFMRAVWALALTLASLPTLASVRASAKPPENEKPVDFTRDVRPILSKNCFPCHGQDEAHRSSGLRLDRRDDAVKPLEDGLTAIVPGDLDASELVARIDDEDDAARMPPAKTGNALTADEKDVLKRWVKQGAPYAEHWAYLPVRSLPLPAIKDKHREWPRNGIDRWILKRLEDEGVAPSPEADRFTLLRRLSLDLRGLPPTPREIESFANDHSLDAYEKAVDRLLADPAYGERWARMWLDLARYADSAGYGSDPLRTIWRYRDWVVSAFNRNLPYDQFTIEQIAGDLLPNPSLDQRIATAFHRNTMTNTEGGTDDEEFRVAAIKDRVDSTMQVWMGLTMGCAKCHTHKYDPIAHEDYYRFYAFFNQTADNDQPSESPTIPAPTPEIDKRNREIDAQIAGLRRKLETSTPELLAAQGAWEKALGSPARWTPLGPESATAESGATVRVQPDGSLKVEGKAADRDSYAIVAKTEAQAIAAIRLETIPDPSLPKGGAGRSSDGNFVLTRVTVEAEPAAPASASTAAPVARYARIELPGAGKMLSLAEVQVFSGSENVALKGEASQSSVDYEGPAKLAIDGMTNGHYFDAKSTTHTKTESDPWWEVKLAEAKPIDRIAVWNRTDGGVGVRLAGFRVLLLDENRRTVWRSDENPAPSPQVALSPSGRRAIELAKASADFAQDQFAPADVIETPGQRGKPRDKTKGWAVGPRQTEPHALSLLLKEPLSLTGPTALTIRLEHQYRDPGYTLGRFRLSFTTDPSASRRLDVPDAILAIIDSPDETRTQAQRDALAVHYRSIAPALKPTRDEIAKLEKSRPEVPAVPVMVELADGQKRKTAVMIKGNHLSLGKEVEPGVPSAFHPFPKDAPANRLGLARWLIDPQNPLTARVAVNRYWAQVFGAGLVDTEEDFGAQGQLPTHPELLDWLATEYQRSGWDTKKLLRLMVTSATYRQSAKTRPELAKRDPRNELLARANRVRLEAEMVRDQALALSGLLSRKVGGPSVFPPQPDGLWQAAFNGQRTWSTSQGEDRYRRGLYTFWRRTVPYPSMATFDAPSREVCAIKRIRTNTPLQALVTMNDPVYVETAQALARRIMKEGGSSPHERARFALALCLGRPAHDRQVEPLVKLYESELAEYREAGSAAQALATEPLGPLPSGMDAAEAAAWTAAANVLLNLDGVLTKG